MAQETAMTDPSIADLFKEYARVIIETYPAEGRMPSDTLLLGDLFRSGWSQFTCSPTYRKNWTSLRPEIGQCAVTALVTQDVFGGTVVRCLVDGFGSHYSNLIKIGEVVHPQDYTRSQFPAETVFPMSIEAHREYMLMSPGGITAATEERYRLLRGRIEKMMHHTLEMH